MRPIWLAVPLTHPVNHSAPSGPAVIPFRLAPVRRGYSVMLLQVPDCALALAQHASSAHATRSTRPGVVLWTECLVASACVVCITILFSVAGCARQRRRAA